jgi:hypothetical protein
VGGILDIVEGRNPCKQSLSGKRNIGFEKLAELKTNTLFIRISRGWKNRTTDHVEIYEKGEMFVFEKTEAFWEAISLVHYIIDVDQFFLSRVALLRQI